MTEIERHCEAVRDALHVLPYSQLEEVVGVLMDCYLRDGTVYLAGNGGSASTASHFAGDLTKGTRQASIPRFRTVALTDNVPQITAWGNDEGFEHVFAEQLYPLVRAGDVVILLSASGSSPNVLAAAMIARSAGATVVAWTGKSGGRLAVLADLAVRVPADTMEAVEDAHMIVAHALTVSVRARLRERAASVASVSSIGTDSG